MRIRLQQWRLMPLSHVIHYYYYYYLLLLLLLLFLDDSSTMRHGSCWFINECSLFLYYRSYHLICVIFILLMARVSSLTTHYGRCWMWHTALTTTLAPYRHLKCSSRLLAVSMDPFCLSKRVIIVGVVKILNGRGLSVIIIIFACKNTFKYTNNNFNIISLSLPLIGRGRLILINVELTTPS